MDDSKPQTHKEILQNVFGILERDHDELKKAMGNIVLKLRDKDPPEIIVHRIDVLSEHTLRQLQRAQKVFDNSVKIMDDAIKEREEKLRQNQPAPR